MSAQVCQTPAVTSTNLKAVTLTATPPVAAPLVALIVVDPLPRPLTCPVALTVAIAGSELDQVTVALATVWPFASLSVATKRVVSSFRMESTPPVTATVDAT